MKTQHLSVSLTLALLLASGVAFAQHKQRLANEGTIGDKWMLADGIKLATAEYPVAFASRGANACIALGYLIGKDGSTSDFAVLKQWNSESGEKEPADQFWQSFATAGADAVAQWKFKPRPEVTDPTPTYTVTTLGFQGEQGADPVEVRSHCKIADLTAHLAQMKSKGSERDDLNKRRMDQDYRNQRQQEMQSYNQAHK